MFYLMVVIGTKLIKYILTKHIWTVFWFRSVVMKTFLVYHSMQGEGFLYLYRLEDNGSNIQ